MAQTIFETKQRADELIKKAMEIWSKSDQSDHLEGVEKDPVFSLLMTALAYQANETENEIEQVKSEVLEAFFDSLVPFEVGHAIPATAVVQTALQGNLSEMELMPHHVFTLGDSEVEFIPLLRTRVINASVRAIVRMDGRRWKVTLGFKTPVSDLTGFTFAIRNHHYADLRVSVDGQPLPLVNPWDYSDLPLSPCFALDTILYNKLQTYMASSLCLDLFARQNVRMYCVKRHSSTMFLPREMESIDLIFEFMGVGENFVFDKDNLSLNAVLLVNAQQRETTLSPSSPIVRVAGHGSQQNTGQTGGASQFLHLLRPSDDQMYGTMPVEVRQMGADRFNQGRLAKLLNVLIGKYYSDYYAYMDLGESAGDRVIYNLAQILTRMSDAVKSHNDGSTPGVYLMLRHAAGMQSDASMAVSYMTTAGATINGLLKEDSLFVPPTGFEAGMTRQIAPPVLGQNEIRDEQATASLARYYMATNDRLVTPADIKLFCYHELLSRYGIVRAMVKSLTVNHRQQFDYQQCGYEILVEIVLVGNSFVKRGFADKVQSVEVLLKSLISVRSANIYPVRVSISIES